MPQKIDGLKIDQEKIGLVSWSGRVEIEIKTFHVKTISMDYDEQKVYSFLYSHKKPQ